MNLTNEEMETWVKARRQRDIMTYTGQSQISQSRPGKNVESPEEKNKEEGKGEPDEKGSSGAVGPPAPPADEPKPKATGSEPPSKNDPQLRKAIDYLQERLLKASEPRPA